MFNFEQNNVFGLGEPFCGAYPGLFATLENILLFLCWFFLRFLLHPFWFREPVPRVLSFLSLIFFFPVSSRRTFLSLPHFRGSIFCSVCSVAHEAIL